MNAGSLSSPPSQARVLRHPSQVVVSVALAALLICGVMFVAADLIGTWPAVAVAACAGAILSFRELRSAVIADERGVTVRNFSRATSWTWDEIASVERIEHVDSRRPPEVFVVDAAGDRTPVVALSGTHVQTRAFRAWGAAQVEWLNHEVRRHSHRPG